MNSIENSRARFDYDILETVITGIVLSGSEVKSVRTGKCSIKGSYAKILAGELWLVGATISPYQSNNLPSGDKQAYDDQRTRKLLVKKSELKYLTGKSQERGLTLVPLKIFDAHGLIKLELGIARGKKKYDKRASTKNRETKRTIRRALK